MSVYLFIVMVVDDLSHLKSAPLGAFPSIRSKSVDGLEEQIARLIGAKIVDLPEGASDLDAKGNSGELSRTSIWHCSYGAPISLDFPSNSHFRLQYCLNGSATSVIDKKRFPITKYQSCILPSDGRPTVGEFGRDYRQIILRIDAKKILAVLTALISVPISRQLTFDSAVDLTTPASQHLLQITQTLVHSIELSASGLAPNAIHALEEALLVAFLCANRHNHSHLLERPQPSAAPWQVRRVEEYIEANWDKPISIEDIAAVTGISARTIFRTFRQTRGCSPLAFAKQVRLSRAQQMLKSGDATTVTDVAFACGFGDLAHFSKDYRRAFGQTPSEILRIGQGPLRGIE